MAKKPSQIWNDRMFELMDFCIDNNIKCSNKLEWCDQIGIIHNTLNQIRDGRSSFRHAHILKAAKVFSIDLNWIYGLSDTMIYKPKQVNHFTAIRAHLKAIEDQK